MRSVRIFLIDDATVRDGLKLIINAQSDMQVVGEADDATRALYGAPDVPPDVLIVDGDIGGSGGVAACRELKRQWPEPKLLALARLVDRDHLRELFRAGASGYALKQSPSETLVDGIRVVSAGRTFMDPSLAVHFMRTYCEIDSLGGRRLDATGALTSRELDVLRLIAWGYSNKEIAARFDLSVKTIEAHRANALRKLDIENRVGLVRLARIKGWLDSEP